MALESLLTTATVELSDIEAEKEDEVENNDSDRLEVSSSNGQWRRCYGKFPMLIMTIVNISQFLMSVDCSLEEILKHIYNNVYSPFTHLFCFLNLKI